MSDALLQLSPDTAMAVCGLAPIWLFAALWLVDEGAGIAAVAVGLSPRVEG